MSDTVYCYPNSNVLINKLGIKDKNKLSIIERRLTMLRLFELLKNPIQGKFDLEHLQSIHSYIFQDIYECSGKIRTVDIAKGNMFCNVKFIVSQANDIFSKLRRDKYLESLGHEDFIKKSAYYFSEINALHPFREGNGRSQREFIRTLALKNGYIIHYSKISAEEMAEASKESFLCKYNKMENIIRKCTQYNGKYKCEPF